MARKGAIRKAVLIVAALVLVAFAIGTALFITGWTAPGPAKADTELVVPRGATLRDTADLLAERGLVRSPRLFYLSTRALAGSPVIKAGEYLIPKGASNREIVAILTGGVGISRFVTIPEGMPSIMVYDRLLAARELTGDVAIPAEGSVLPDTYAYARGEKRAAVLARMQSAMTKALDEAWAARSANTVVKNRKEAVTLASIVEKETSIAAERPTVAGVYSNRLRKGMMLQADPTIIYPITKGKPLGRRIRRSEITAVNGYNTYAMTGLPEGPIANPSLSSIRAVLNPARTNALYFVADGRGGHIFADTLEQHNANVRKWYAIRRARGEM